MKGIIFDIKEFSIHDGPGARITVFLKGCPLRCRWCHNTEGLSALPQLMIKENLCVHCGRCIQGCNHSECIPFKRCIHACPNGCISVSGKMADAAELAKKINSSAEILSSMGGGVTFSGGEPMMQPEFVCEIAELLPNVHKALQTSGFADFETYTKIVSKMDFVMQDIKLADKDEHIKYTGVSNEKILNNIEWLKKSGRKFVFRVPLIPGITDTKANLSAISEIAEDFPVELLRYNSIAGAKYAMLGMTYPLGELKGRSDDYVKYFKNAKIE